MHMPPLETVRLLIRPFDMDDLDAIYQLLDVDLAEADMGNQGALAGGWSFKRFMACVR